MREPKSPANEAARLAKLEGYEILDTLPEEAYDDIVTLAANICGVPIALVSLVDTERQWFKARVGLDASQTPRSVSFCGHVVENGEFLEVPDAFEDARFFDNPLVVGEPRVRFYAGMPLRTEDGLVLGTLCVIDHESRQLDESQRQALAALSRVVMRQLDLREKTARGAALAETAVQAESEAARLRSLHQSFFSVSLDLLAIASFDGYFKELNPAWEPLLGYTVDELMGQPFMEFIHPEDHAPTQETTAALAERQQVVNFRNRFRRRDGGWVWLAWHAALDRSAGLMVASARDVTAQKEYEDALVQAAESAQAADRAKSQFLATMSHELRTPLNAIIGFSKILGKNKAENLSEKDLKFVDRIQANGAHLLTLINEVLDLSKIEAGQMTFTLVPCSVNSLVKAVLSLQESLAREKHIELHADFGADDEYVPFVADEHRLRQVLLNLVSNAIKFTDEGSVTIRALPHPGTRRVAAIEVSDTGVGIPSEDLGRVFQAFEQVDGKMSRRHQGTGLGLAISASLCEGMGMDIEIESVLGAGTTARISVPQSLSREAERGRAGPEPGARVPAESAAATAGPSKARRVLVIDDNPDARHLIAEQLRELGCEYRTASGGEEGLRIARGWRPDLITLDLMMPTMSGWQVLERIRDSPDLADIPVAIVSLTIDVTSGQPVDGAVDVLSKPVDRERLEQVLDRASTGRPRRALIVEDDADARLVLAEFLEAEGWEVAETETGLEGHAALPHFKPDVIFLDLMMPVLDGFEFLGRIGDRSDYEHVPVVVVSAKDLRDDERHALLRRATAIVEKGADLVPRLAEILARIESPRPSTDAPS
jgi:PAS domain S-box-containing protein